MLELYFSSKKQKPWLEHARKRMCELESTPMVVKEQTPNFDDGGSENENQLNVGQGG